MPLVLDSTGMSGFSTGGGMGISTLIDGAGNEVINLNLNGTTANTIGNFIMSYNALGANGISVLASQAKQVHATRMRARC